MKMESYVRGVNKFADALFDTEKAMRKADTAVQFVSTDEGRKAVLCVCEMSMMDGEILAQIKEVLEAYPCSHGKHTVESTPPMMYPEAIACAIRHAMSVKSES